MCGIVYCKSFKKRPINNVIKGLYKNQRTRGWEGFGFYDVKNDILAHHTTENGIMRLLRRNKSNEILFHHRMPTSTDNVRRSCHPFSTKSYFENEYIVVHNGIVMNDDELRRKHSDLGISYVSEDTFGLFNDSEALTYDIARYLEGLQNTITATGSIAFIAIRVGNDKNPEKIFWGRNYGSPLKVVRSKKGIRISSEGSGEDVPVNEIYTLDDNNEIKKYSNAYMQGSFTTYYSCGRGWGGVPDYNFHDDDELCECGDMYEDTASLYSSGLSALHVTLGVRKPTPDEVYGKTNEQVEKYAWVVLDSLLDWCDSATTSALSYAEWIGRDIHKQRNEVLNSYQSGYTKNSSEIYDFNTDLYLELDFMESVMKIVIKELQDDVEVHNCMLQSVKPLLLPKGQKSLL